MDRYKLRDRVLLACLREDSRLSLAEIARRCSIPLTTVFERVKRLEKSPILRYASLLSFRNLGLDMHVFIAVKAKKQSKADVMDFLLAHNQVNTLHRTNGNADYFAEAVFRDLKELNDFLEAASRKGSESIKVFYVKDELGKERFYAPDTRDILDCY